MVEKWKKYISQCNLPRKNQYFFFLYIKIFFKVCVKTCKNVKSLETEYLNVHSFGQFSLSTCQIRWHFDWMDFEAFGIKEKKNMGSPQTVQNRFDTVWILERSYSSWMTRVRSLAGDRRCILTIFFSFSNALVP